MKISIKIATLCLLAASFVLVGCNKKKEYSNKTGWVYNSPDEGFFNVNTQYHGKCPNGMVYLTVTSSIRGQNDEMVSAPENNDKKRVATSSFYMDIYEVTNQNWREYFSWMEIVFRHDPRQVVLALPDESVWRKELAYNEPYVRDYYTHVAYNNYPVVGVSWRQATDYCTWRTDRLNENELIRRRVLPYKSPVTINQQLVDYEVPTDSAFKFYFTSKHARDYVTNLNLNPDEAGDEVYFEPDLRYDINGDEEIDAGEWRVALDGVLFDAEIRLPTETEWEYAAYGLPVDKGAYMQTHQYPWAGDQLRDFTDKKERGKFQANFLKGRGDPIGIQLNGTLTLPVNFFQPNSFGLYNMAGNVNEWVKDVYRADPSNVDEINSYRGNQFESDNDYATDVINKHFAYMDPEQMDSMKKILIAERGIIKTGGDYRDFKDGDKTSSIKDSVLIYRESTPIEQANMISNTARVYKGGGWNDRALWLNPANRRWLEETRSRNDIGFRCVMSAVGGYEQSREMIR